MVALPAVVVPPVQPQPEKMGEKSIISARVDGNSRVTSIGCVVEKNETAVGGRKSRKTGRARIMKFGVRSILCCDRRVISRAVVQEFYEAGIEAAIRINLASDDIRSASRASAFEVHRGVERPIADDMERRTIFGLALTPVPLTVHPEHQSDSLAR